MIWKLNQSFLHLCLDPVQNSVTTGHCTRQDSPVTPELNLFCLLMASLHSIFMPVAAHTLTSSVSRRQWFLHEQLWNIHSIVTCWVHNYECSYWKHTTEKVMLLQSKNRNNLSACLGTCTPCVRLQSDCQSLLELLPQKLWKSKKVLTRWPEVGK